MNQMSELIAKIKKDRLENPQCIGFDFFLIKIKRLDQQITYSLHKEEEQVVQFIDISEKIFVDNMNIERKYLTYINATVSHEMRNPLNSINAQIESQHLLLSDLEVFKASISDRISNQEAQTLQSIISDLLQGLSISQSSCKLMNFNVEDIMALPTLKEGKL